MDFNFPEKEGTGIAKLSPHISAGTLSENVDVIEFPPSRCVDAQDLIIKLLTYNPDNRITATSAIKHPYFKEIRE